MSDNIWTKSLDELRQQDNFRAIQALDSCQDGYITCQGKRLLNLCSNNYLGMANHPSVIEAFRESVLEWGAGSGGARLLGGTQQPHIRLEEILAAEHKSPGALVFNSGYTANFSIIPAISGHFNHILCDRLNHASIIDGIIQSRNSFDRYRHVDMDHLESMLKKQINPEKTLVISETLFSMEGDFVPLNDLLDLQKRYPFFLYLDEAHSFGGYPEFLKPIYQTGYERAVVMGTLGKAIGCFGAFVAGSQNLIEFLINKCRGFIFSTSLPAGIVSAAAASIDILRKEKWRVDNLMAISNTARMIFRENKLKTGKSSSHILPVITGSNRFSLDAARKLFECEIYALSVRPPTVPAGTSRIRFSLNYEVRESDLSKAAKIVSEVLTPVK